jgi:hypothetical protein
MNLRPVTEYPFFYFYDFDWDRQAVLDYFLNLPESGWRSPKITNFTDEPGIDTYEGDHPATGLIWVASSQHTDFISECPAVAKIADTFSITPNTQAPSDKIRIFRNMIVKKSKRGHDPGFHHLLQNKQLDERFGITRTADIIFPLQGGFKQDPLQALDTRTGKEYTLVPKGVPFMVPNEPFWHYRWNENEFDWRLTLHFRCIIPVTYDLIRKHFYKPEYENASE